MGIWQRVGYEGVAHPGNGALPLQGSVSIVARSSWNLDIFWKDGQGRVFDTYWYYGAPSWVTTTPLSF